MENKQHDIEIIKEQALLNRRYHSELAKVLVVNTKTYIFSFLFGGLLFTILGFGIAAITVQFSILPGSKYAEHQNCEQSVDPGYQDVDCFAPSIVSAVSELHSQMLYYGGIGFLFGGIVSSSWYVARIRKKRKEEWINKNPDYDEKSIIGL